MSDLSFSSDETARIALMNVAYPEWKIVLTFTTAGERTDVIAMTIDQINDEYDPEVGLGSVLLRDLSVGHAIIIGRRIVGDGLRQSAEGGGGWHASPDLRRDLLKKAAAYGRNPGNKRSTRDDDWYLTWALRYVDKRFSDASVKELAAEYGYSESYLRGVFKECERRDLLTPATQGKYGRDLTDKARALLARREES